MSKGITVVELLLVTSIILTLGVMSISFHSRFIMQNALDNTANQLIGSFRKAQIYSLMGKQNGVWGVKYSSPANEITLYLTGTSAFDENFSVNNNISVSGFTDISFAKATGIPSSTATIIVSGSNNNRTMMINSQGVISKTN